MLTKVFNESLRWLVLRDPYSLLFFSSFISIANLRVCIFLMIVLTSGCLGRVRRVWGSLSVDAGGPASRWQDGASEAASRTRGLPGPPHEGVPSSRCAASSLRFTRATNRSFLSSFLNLLIFVLGLPLIWFVFTSLHWLISWHWLSRLIAMLFVAARACCPAPQRV